MPYVELEIPPGVYANGTARQARGRWRLANLVRWPNGPDLQPVGGWRRRSPDAAPIAAAARAIVSWRDNDQDRWIAIGTHLGLWVMSALGVLDEITPAGFTAGEPDASVGGGYGAGPYGWEPPYGMPRAEGAEVTPASVWTLDTWGQHLVGCCEGDGRLYEWTLDPDVPAAGIAGAPEDCRAVVVTAENFIFALRDRNVKWCDQADSATWTAAATNQAGEIDLQTPGRLMCGRRVRGATLVFSDVDLWAAQYLGGVAVYGFQRVGADCGVVARGAAVSLDTRAVWMGRGTFFTYDGGAVGALDCEVADHVFADLNEQQISKVSAWHNAGHGEVWWHYPSAGSNENNRYVAWSYRTGRWSTGEMARTCGTSAGVFPNPLLVSPGGEVWEHEVGWAWGDSDAAEERATPYARSGPLELGAGDRVMAVAGVVGDEKTQGQAEVRFFARGFPNAGETEHGPFALGAAPTDARFSARQVETQVDFTAETDSRVGVMRLDVRAAGRR